MRQFMGPNVVMDIVDLNKKISGEKSNQAAYFTLAGSRDKGLFESLRLGRSWCRKKMVECIHVMPHAIRAK